ncbi:MAG: hypothetical protein ACOCZX_06070 [Candidatus Bipolaricaulota bacterium]
MDAKTHYSLLAVLIAGLVMASAFGGQAQVWQPFSFRGNESYRYQINWQNGEENSAIYSLTISQNDSGKYTVEYSTEIEAEELSSELAFGYWGTYGPSLQYMFWNPMYEMLFSQLELKVGEKMSYLDFGTMEVKGKENVAGFEGFVCELSDTDGEKTAEWVIDPEIALPLRSYMYEGNVDEGEVVLLDYETF